MIHDVRKKWKMFTNCPCGEDRQECEAGKGQLPADKAEQTLQEVSSAACTESVVPLDENEPGKAVCSVPPMADDASGQKSARPDDCKPLTSSSCNKEMDQKVSDVSSKSRGSKPRTSSSGKNKVVDKKVVGVPPKNGDSKLLTSSPGKKEVDVSPKIRGIKPRRSSSVNKEVNQKVFDVPPKNGDSKPLTSSSGKKEVDRKLSDVSPKNRDIKPLKSTSVKKEVDQKLFDVPRKSGDSKPRISTSRKKEMDGKVSDVAQTTVDTAGWKSPKTGSGNPIRSSSALRNMIMKNISLADVKRESKSPNKTSQTLDDVAQRVAGNYKLHCVALAPRPHFLQDPQRQTSVTRKANPITRNCLSITQLQHPDVAHAWLDDGRLLQLLEPRHHANILLFQQQWKNGQPVLISNCQQYLNQDLWLPESFAREFGDEENDLVDCSRKVGKIRRSHG